MLVNLRHMQAICKYAASTEATRYYLNGVFVIAENSTVTMVATDGHRMIVHRAPVDAAEGFSCIVPAKFLLSMRFAKRDTGEAEISKSGNVIRVKHGDTVTETIEVDGTFPDWTRARPADNVDPAPAMFNGKYLHDFDLLAKEFETFATVTPRGSDIALVTFGRDDLYGALAPMREDRRNFAMKAPF